MPANKSLNKVRVTRLFGGSATIATMDPAINMRVKQGLDYRWIVAMDSGNGQVSLALTSGGTPISRDYPHNLVVDQVTASGFGFPSASQTVLFGHAGLWSAGVPTTPGSGHSYMNANGTVTTYGR